MYRVSIVIPVYNSAKSIEVCLDSIFLQSFTNFEIIFVNDGSTDGSVDIINKYLRNRGFKDFKLLSQKNSGPGMARNLGINNASCDLLAFIDSDDIWEKDHLLTLVNFLLTHKADLVCTTKSIKVNKCFQITLLKLLFRCYIQSSTLLVKKKFLIKSQFRNGKRYSEDYDLWLRLAASGLKMIFLPITDVKSFNDKKLFGESGLSQNLLEMEKNELENYKYLLKNKNISFPLYLSAVLFSLSKYVLRKIKKNI